VLRDLAVVRFMQKDVQALRIIEEALGCRRNDPQSLIVSARIQLVLGGDERADPAYLDAQLADRSPILEQGYVKRYLALACLRQGQVEETITHAREALALGDMTTYNQFLIAIAERKLGQDPGAALTLARTAWPEALKTPRAYEPSAVRGFLWFESADELLALEAELVK